MDDWGNAPFAQSITGSGLPGLFPLHRPQSFRKVSTTDVRAGCFVAGSFSVSSFAHDPSLRMLCVGQCSVIEEQLQEFRSFKDSFYQAS